MEVTDETLRKEEEMRLRNLTQYQDAMRYRDTAVLMEGRALTDTEVFVWYVQIGFAHMFSIAWEEGQKELNLYYTGLKVGHPATPPEGWEHYKEYWQSLAYNETCPA
ncbi:MAG: hypothetical protein WCV68_03125 [Candidatus Paceibacterota bacterium]